MEIPILVPTEEEKQKRSKPKRSKSFLARVKDKLNKINASSDLSPLKVDRDLKPEFNGIHTDIEADPNKEILETEIAQELKVAFDMYSKGMSTIPCREIGYVLRTLGQNPTEDDIVNLVNEAGCHWDGFLSRDDFMSVGLVSILNQANKLDDVRMAFDAFDRNGDGRITIEEMRDAMTRYGHLFTLEEAQEMFKEADLNADGRIDFQEFLSMMLQGHTELNVNFL